MREPVDKTLADDGHCDNFDEITALYLAKMGAAFDPLTEEGREDE